MEILSVALKNFKSHRDAYFEFQPGTNAICGENGAGKTSILEAIAWALFNYKGSYKSEDLIHSGTASGLARVSFVSSFDGRTYEVQRCTQKGYQVYDPQLKVKLDLNRIEEDILPWLRQHMGVPPGTDLARLFGNTVGVPQGTFTADFLATEKERKKTFDATLKVEEYRQAYDKAGSLEKYARVEVEKLEQAIAYYTETLRDWDPLQAKHLELQEEIQQVETALQTCQAQLRQLKQEKTELAAQATRMQQLTLCLETLTAQIQSQQQLDLRLEREVQSAQQAVSVCQVNQTGHQQFLAAETALQDLEQRRRRQQLLLDQWQAYREQRSDRQTQLATLRHQLKRFTLIQSELEQLSPLIEQQTELEQQQQVLGQHLQACQTWRRTVHTEHKQLQHSRDRLEKVSSEIKAIAALARTVEQIPVLEQHQQRYQQQLSRVEAAQQFEAELRQILRQGEAQRNHHLTQVEQAQDAVAKVQQTMPLLRATLQPVLVALATSDERNHQLLEALQIVLQDLSEQVSTPRLAQQLQQTQQQLQLARQHQVRFAQLDPLMDRQTVLKAQVEDLQASLAYWQTQLVAEPALLQQQSQFVNQLTALGNPRGLKHLYQQELQQQTQVEAQIQAIEQSLQASQAAIADLETQLHNYVNLPEQIQVQQERRESQRTAYQTYLEHQQLAHRLKDRQAEQAAAIAQLKTLESEARTVATDWDQLSKTFDAQRFEAVQSLDKELETQQITLSARLPEILKRLQDANQQLEHLKIIQLKRDRTRIELVEREKAKHLITFARKAYKQAGPRITERYVQSISREADKLFRELLNRQNVALEWTREYEILVQEGANLRRFVNLSGGEQMCAALAVRLALLKVLADIDIAFFDEPTTNMDRLRREQLADAIANIKSFRQLFVISHDDTFEKVTGNVVLVKRQAE